MDELFKENSQLNSSEPFWRYNDIFSFTHMYKSKESVSNLITVTSKMIGLYSAVCRGYLYRSIRQSLNSAFYQWEQKRIIQLCEIFAKHFDTDVNKMITAGKTFLRPSHGRGPTPEAQRADRQWKVKVGNWSEEKLNVSPDITLP